MNKKLIFVFLLTFITSLLSANESILDKLDRIFKVEKLNYKGNTYITKNVNKLPEKDPFANLVNNNTLYLDYLLVNYSKHIENNKLLKIKDMKKLNNKFIQELKKDEKFIKLLKEFEYYYLNNNEKRKTEISFDKFLNLSTKFFAVTKIINNKYSVHICVGLNLIKETENERLPHVEAFLFNTIQNQMKENNKFVNELYKNIKKLYKINFGSDNKKRLLRAQGALLMLMFENKELKNIIISEYKKYEKYLPFKVKDIK